MAPKGQKVSVRARNLIQVLKAQIAAETKGRSFIWSRQAESPDTRPPRGAWILDFDHCWLGITFSYFFSLRCLSCRIWYPACSQNTFPASLFCIINLRRTKSLTNSSTSTSTCASAPYEVESLKRCRWRQPVGTGVCWAFDGQPQKSLCDLLLSYTQGLAGSLQPACRQVTRRLVTACQCPELPNAMPMAY